MPAKSGFDFLKGIVPRRGYLHGDDPRERGARRRSLKRLIGGEERKTKVPRPESVRRSSAQRVRVSFKKSRRQGTQATSSLL